MQLIKEPLKVPSSVHEEPRPEALWLKVSKTEIQSLGIGSRITPFSRVDGDDVYLESQYDAVEFLKAKTAAGEEVDLGEPVTSDLADISKLPNYRG